MVKLVSPSGWNFDVPVSSLVKVASDGRLRGHDRRQFIKRAGDAAELFLPRLDQIKIAADEEAAHLIALGSSEHWGCFAAGTPIAAADGRYDPIELTEVGDQVLSADGHICEVAHLFRRTCPQSLSIDVGGLADTLNCSIDHPFRVARREQFTCQHDKYKRCLPALQGRQNICNRPKHFVRDCVTADYPTIVTEWAEAKTLCEGDFLVCTLPQVSPPISMCASEGYLFGAWLAEGWFQRTTGNRAISSIQLSIHSDEWKFAYKLQDCAVSLGLTYNFYQGQDKNKNSGTVSITGDPERFRLWFSLFHHRAKEKRLPPWTCCLPEPTRLAILAGYIDGDGCCVVDDKENRTTARSHGRDLSLGLQRLFWSVGVMAVRCTATDVGWNVSATNVALDKIRAFSWKIQGRELKQTSKVHGFVHEGRAYLPVRGIAERGELEVYNFEVAGDHTYSGPNVDSHNCNRNGDGFKAATLRQTHDTFEKFAKAYRNHANRDPLKSYGVVKLAAYNPTMHRVELIVAYNRTKSAADRNQGLIADLEIQKLAKDENLPVSMACRVSHDTCSFCGNKAKTRDEYCKEASCGAGGCLSRLGQLVKVGADVHHLHVDNPDPSFFDISSVFRPADRTAYGGRADWIEKAASADGFIDDSIKLANDLVAHVPLDVCFDAALRATAKTQVQSRIKLAYGLTAVECDPERQAPAGLDAAFTPAVQPPIAWPESLDQEKRAELLNALASQEIVLPLREYARLFKRAEDAPGAATHLPAIYRRLLSQHDIVGRLDAATAGYEKSAGQAQRLLASQLQPHFGLTPEIVECRAVRASLRGGDSNSGIEIVKSAAVSPAAEDLALDYAAYTLAALEKIASAGGDLMRIAKLVISQNRVAYSGKGA